MFRRWAALFLCLFVSLPAFTLWKTLKTDAFTVFYPSGREREAQEILEVLEYYRSYTGDLVGAPLRRVAVVLEDIGRESNGLTDVTPLRGNARLSSELVAFGGGARVHPLEAS